MGVNVHFIIKTWNSKHKIHCIFYKVSLCRNKFVFTSYAKNGMYELGLVRYLIYRSIAILAKVRYRYLVVSRYFDIFGIELPLFETFDTSDISTSSPFDDVDAKAQHRCRWRRCLRELPLPCLTWLRRGCLKNNIKSNVNCFLKLYCRVSLYNNCFLYAILDLA